MAIITKKKKSGVSYLVRIRDNSGKWFPSKSFKKKVDAEKFQRKLIHSKENGKQAFTDVQKNLIFRDYCILWKHECRTNTSEGWKGTQDQMLKDYILPFLADCKVINIKRRDVAIVLQSMIDDYSPQTRLHVYNLLHKIFQDAIDHFEFIELNPVSKKLRPKNPEKERKYLTPTQARILLSQTKDMWFGAAVWIALLSGLRISEIQALTWDAIDFENSEILIKAAYNRKEKRLQPYPKQRKWCKVPLTPDLKQYLYDFKKQCEPAPNDFVVTSPDKTTMLSYHSFLTALKRVTKALGFAAITPHELRHSCTELFIEQGASPEDIRRLLNQSSLSATRRYIHRGSERLSHIANKVNALDNNSNVISIHKVR